MSRTNAPDLLVIALAKALNAQAATAGRMGYELTLAAPFSLPELKAHIRATMKALGWRGQGRIAFGTHMNCIPGDGIEFYIWKRADGWDHMVCIACSGSAAKPALDIHCS
jgi:hypothetical protein